MRRSARGKGLHQRCPQVCAGANGDVGAAGPALFRLLAQQHPHGLAESDETGPDHHPVRDVEGGEVEVEQLRDVFVDEQADAEHRQGP